jgi:hypothetical protein
MAHRISEDLIAYDAAATLQEWFEGYMTLEDGRQYKVVQVEAEGTLLIIQVEGSQFLDVEEEQFEVEVVVRRVDP